MEVPFAFTAGLVATLNPCGFAMLPAYPSYYRGSRTKLRAALLTEASGR